MLSSERSTQPDISRILELQRDDKLAPTVHKFKRVLVVGASRSKLCIELSLLVDDRPEGFIVTFDVRGAGEQGIGVRGTTGFG